MEKNKSDSNQEYKWWEDPYLWSEDDGEDLEDREMTNEERQRLEEMFKQKSED